MPERNRLEMEGKLLVPNGWGKVHVSEGVSNMIRFKSYDMSYVNLSYHMICSNYFIR